MLYFHIYGYLLTDYVMIGILNIVYPKPVLKEVRFSKTAVFGPQRPRVAFDRLGSSLTPNP